MISKTLLALALAALSVNATPVPQGETRLLQPTNGPVPASCKLSYNGMFAIAPVKATGVPIPSAPAKFRRAVGQQGDGQITGGAAQTVPVATQIGDAQPQVPTVPVVTQIGDAQPQAPVKTMMPLSQINDGQVQGYYHNVVTQIGDAQPQAPVATQPAVSQIQDAQPQAQASTSPNTGNSGTFNTGMVACRTDSTLVLDVQNGRLVDGKGRIGYIAANYQFQFDAGVPQTGAIITTGFNVCDDGTLGLGSSQVFWQCLSGSFYNLYDRYWAPQCEPVYLKLVTLKDC